MNTPLYDAVRLYIEQDRTRFHMPGHKGQGFPPFSEILPWDITEVAGADSLFHADGAIDAFERIAAQVYGARRTLLCAGGATLCIQTMLALACGAGGTVVMGRNLHRAAINAAALLDLAPVWVMPDNSAGAWFSGRYTPQAIETALAAHPEAAAVYITSPDYFGVMSDVAAISAVCRARGVPLLVDNAHGAHLRFLPERYGNMHPIECGASMCADSLHKTLPAMTGGALLHISQEQFAGDAKRMMSVFGSTSPSYPIMLSCERAVAYAADGAAGEGFERTARAFDALRCFALQKGFALPLGLSDPAKLSLCFGARGDQAGEFGAHLRSYGVEPEYISENACVLMANGENTARDFERLRAALDGLRPPVGRAAPPAAQKLPERALSVRAALFSPHEQVPVENCAGRIAACDCSPCPPGVPVVMPGERIDGDIAAALRRYGVRTVRVLPLF